MDGEARILFRIRECLLDESGCRLGGLRQYRHHIRRDRRHHSRCRYYRRARKGRARFRCGHRHRSALLKHSPEDMEAVPQRESKAASHGAWRCQGTESLPEVFRSVPVPETASFWRKMLAFAGPGFLVSVGYMDPGNWATDLAGGARYGYSLLSVILISNLMAILLQ